MGIQAAILVAAPILTSGFASAGDADAGRALAEEWCTKCHIIEAGAPHKLHPPSFASIAVFRSTEQIYGRIAFPTRHANMPGIGDLFVTPEAIDDLVAYITSLEPRQ